MTIDTLKIQVRQNKLFTSFSQVQKVRSEKELSEANNVFESVNNERKMADLNYEKSMDMASNYMMSGAFCPHRVGKLFEDIHQKKGVLKKVQNELEIAKYKYETAQSDYLKAHQQHDVLSTKLNQSIRKLDTEKTMLQDKDMNELYTIRIGKHQCL